MMTFADGSRSSLCHSRLRCWVSYIDDIVVIFSACLLMRNSCTPFSGGTSSTVLEVAQLGIVSRLSSSIAPHFPVELHRLY